MKIEIKKYHKNPILVPSFKAGMFDGWCVYNPAGIVKDNKVFLLYRAEARYKEYISRIGLATSEDGFHFKRYSQNPIISERGRKEKRGIEDPRVTKVDKGYFLTYGAYPGGNKMYLCGAFSKDLIHWKKIGQLVSGREKAGALVQEYKYHGKYVMYFGEGKSLRVALSNNLKKWDVIDWSVLSVRDNYFDDYLVEAGPPPIITKEGIFLIYNSAKKHINYEGEETWLSYSPGVVIFDKKDPTRLIYRSEKPILEATEYWEKYGKANYVIFVSGLVYFKGKWLLYYGGADKSIGVAELVFD